MLSKTRTNFDKVDQLVPELFSTNYVLCNYLLVQSYDDGSQCSLHMKMKTNVCSNYTVKLNSSFLSRKEPYSCLQFPSIRPV